MSRPRKWPPQPYPHAATGMDRLTVRLAGARKDYILGPTGSVEAAEEYARVIRTIERAGFRLVGGAGSGRGCTILVSDLVARYKVYVDDYYTAESRERDLTVRAMQFLLEAHKNDDVRSVGPVALEAVRRDIEQSGLARSECNRFLTRIKKCYRWGVRQELVPLEVYQRLATVPGLRVGHTEAPERQRRGAVSTETVTKTLPFLTPTLQALVQFQLLTGCRPKEACWLRPCDLQKDWLTVDDTEVWLYSLGGDQHKTGWRGAPCLIPVGPKAQAILEPFLVGRAPEAYCFSPKESRAWWLAEKRRKRKTRVQPSQSDRRSQKPTRLPGDRYATSSYSHAITRACELAGVPHWSPNQLRKRAGTEAQLAHDRDTARCVLRHRSPAVSERYVDDAEKAAVFVAKNG